RKGDASDQSQALGSQEIGPPGGAIGRSPMLGGPCGGSRYPWGTLGVLPYSTGQIGGVRGAGVPIGRPIGVRIRVRIYSGPLVTTRAMSHYTRLADPAGR